MRKSLILFFIYFVSFVYSSVYLNTARIAFFNEQDYTRARNACLEGIKKGETHFELYAILSGCEIACSNWYAAAEALTKAFLSDSSKTLDWIRKKGGGEKYYYQAFYFSARAAFKEGKYEKALEILHNTAFFEYFDKNTAVLKGAVLFKLGRNEEANKIYLDILTRDPKNPDINFLIGKSLFEAEEFDSSLKYFIDAVKYYQPKYERILQVLFQNQTEVDKELSREILELWDAKQIHELDTLFKTKLGFADGIATHTEIMVRLSRAATDLARACYYTGMTYYYLKKDSAALDNLQISLQYKPNDTDALFFAAEILIKFKEYQKAVENLEKITRLNPEDQYAWFYLGVCYTNLKHYEQAIDVYENKMLPVDPNRIDVLTNLAYVYSQIGNYSKANEYLRRAEELQKNKNEKRR